MNFKFLCEQVFFENELSFIAEQAELVAKSLNNLKDYADEAIEKSIEAKVASKQTRDPIDVTQLIILRKQLKQLLKPKWDNNLNDREIEKKLDNYIEAAYIDPSTVKGIDGENLSYNLDLKGLKYLHRKWLGVKSFDA